MANSEALAATMTEMAFVGPKMTNSDAPNNAPQMAAATAVASPAAGGKPAINAYAKLCGIVNNAVVRPAMKSGRK